MAVRLLGWTPRHFDASKLGCGSDCTVTGQIMFKHPAWGFVNLLTTVHGDSSGGYPYNAKIVIVDRNDQIRYRSRTFAGIAKMRAYGITSQSFGPVQSFPDAVRGNDDGNMFIAHNPGRYNGIVVLRPTVSGFEDFGSLPSPGSNSGRFYGGEVLDLKRTGTIVMSINDCNPSCGEGQIGKTIVRWSGTSYIDVPHPNYSTRLCTSSIPHAIWPSPDPAVFQSTVSCSEVVRLINARPKDKTGSSYLSLGYVCSRERAPGDSGGSYYQCVSGSRVVSFFAV